MLEIDLLGRPAITRDGAGADPPRGAKAWALLAYLLRSDVPPARERVASLLFPDASDPAGALRWSLSQVRKALGPGASLGSDPLTIGLPPGAVVDIQVLERSSSLEALSLPGFGGELLAGIAIEGCPAFEIWLDNERRHVAGLTAAVLAEASRARSARGDWSGAVELARRLVELTPYDENAHVLMVRTMALMGDTEAAREQLASSATLLRQELGIDPSAGLTAALDVGTLGLPSAPAGAATVKAQLEAGRTAVGAGAMSAGIEALRRAVVAARAAGERRLLAEALLEIGSALVHAARGTDEEGAGALHEAAALGEELDEPGVAATAARELGYVDVLRARYARADRWLSRARGLAGSDDGEAAWIEAVDSLGRLDVGDHAGARSRLEVALDRAERVGDRRARAFTLANLGRMLLLRRDLADARPALTESVELAREIDWTGFVPWPGALLAEVDLLEGDVTAAADRFEHAFALGCQLGDPCWESISVRGLGLVAAARGESDRALQLLDEAPRRCRRLPDAYLWVEGYALEALAGTAVTVDSPAAPRWVEIAERFASRHGMKELQIRALAHRVGFGVVGAEAAARALADGVDNPAVWAEVTAG